jgi:glutaredoxin
MGRITVFTSNDINSQAAKQALDKRELPYVEINLLKHPQKAKDLESLSGTQAVPQIYFNTRRIGGLAALLAELQTWDLSMKYKSPSERHKYEILKFPDPINPNLSIPDGTAKPVELPSALNRIPTSIVDLPDGTVTSVHDITQKLMNTVPLLESKLRNKVFKNSMSSKDLSSAFMDSMGLTSTEASSFLQVLVDARVLHHLGCKRKFISGEDVYRLQVCLFCLNL